MPLVRIAMMQGASAELRRAAGDAVHQAMVETLNVPAADRFQIITEHAPDSLIYDPSYLDIQRTDGLLIIQITLNEGRDLEMKRSFYRRAAALLSGDAGVRPEDVLISLVEVKKENWSFGDGIAQYARPFVPADFEIPALLETPHFRLRMLSTDDVDKDYDAVMSSADLLHRMFGTAWPRDGFTREENLSDLAKHQREFERRVAFAYTVMRPDEQECLGCIYINPPSDGRNDARVRLWVRQSAYDQGLDPVLFQTVRDWLAERWPFERVAYPGREE